MAPRDVSPTIKRSASNASFHRKAPAAAASSSFSGSVPPPLAVRSMLRTATELGNVGQFECGSRQSSPYGPCLQSTRLRSGSFDSSFASALQHHRSPRHRIWRTHDRHGISTPAAQPHRQEMRYLDPNTYLHLSKPQQLTRRNCHHGLQAPRIRYRNQFLYDDRSLRALRGQHSSRSKHSELASSLLTRTTLQQGYTPSINSARSGSFQRSKANSNQSYGTSSMPSSSASLPFPQEIVTSNQSFYDSGSSLKGDQLSASYNTNLPHNNIMHNFTGKSSSSSPRDVNLVAGKTTQPASLSSNSSSDPWYYDYSEAFMEVEQLSKRSSLAGTVHHDRSDQMCLDAEQPPHKQQRAQTPFGVKPGSIFSPAELPSDYNHYLSHPSDNLPQYPNSDGSLSKLQQIAELSADLEDITPSKDVHQNLAELKVFPHHCPSASRWSLTSSNLGILSIDGSKNRCNLMALTGSTHYVPPTKKIGEEQPLLTNRDDTYLRKSARVEQSDMPELEGSSPVEPDLSQHARDESVEKDKENLNPFQDRIDAALPQPEQPVSFPNRGRFGKVIDVPDYIQFLQKETTSSRAIEELTNIVKLDDVHPFTKGHDIEGVPAKQDTLGLYSEPPNHADPFNSTIDLLLDQHIQSLGLMPEENSSSASTENYDNDGINAEHTHPSASARFDSTVSWPSDIRCKRPTTTTCPLSSPSNSTRMRLKPRRLFASIDGHISAFPEPYFQRVESRREHIHLWTYLHSTGWHNLPSTSDTVSQHLPSQYTITSGELADIDTDIYPLGKRVWRLSQLSLPTSFEEQVSSPRTNYNTCVPRRNRSERVARQKSRRRRRINIIFKQQHRHMPMNASELLQDPTIRRNTQNSLPISPVYAYAELEAGNHQISRGSSPCSKSQDPQIPKRWSSIMAAMPIPPKGIPNVARKASTRTARSQKSSQSQTNLIEPLNSTRQRSQMPPLGCTIPRLALLDFGPPLNTSTLNLSVSYAEMPSTIHPSTRVSRSFFDDSPTRPHIFRKGSRRQRGLRPLRSALYASRVSPVPMKVGLPTRNGIPIAAVGPSSVGAAGLCNPYNIEPINLETTSISQYTCKKRKLTQRFKDWWKRQCMQKALSTRNMKT